MIYFPKGGLTPSFTIVKIIIAVALIVVKVIIMTSRKKSSKKRRDESSVMGFSLASLIDSKDEAKPSSDLQDELLTVSQVAEIRGTSRIAVHELITRGRLKAVEIAGRKFVRRSDLDAFERQKPGPKADE